jgi:glycosyltransferase involved in cell wall biosynthesis
MPILTSNRPGDGLLFALDSKAPIRINPWESYLRGWFVATPAAFEGVNALGVMVEGAFVPALYGFSRPDVATHLDDPKLAKCGFCVRFRGSKREAAIKLVAQANSGVHVLAEVSSTRPASASDSPAPIASYDAWLTYREASLFWPENEVYDRLAALPYRPLVSVILPAFDADPLPLEQCVQSVLGQQYAHWQLCISDDRSSPGLTERLQNFAASDQRITLADTLRQAGVAEAQNRALHAAQGDFIVTLDQNDELHPCALLEVIRRLNQRDNCEAVYSDEDGMDAYGSRSKPVFKPDFDPDLLLASNYIDRLTALRRSTVLRLGGFRSVCEGAQDWDLLIRFLDQVDPAAIQHVPKPLYHRRIRQRQGAPGLRAKLSRQTSSLRALSDHLVRSRGRAVVQPGLFPGSFRLKQAAPPAAKVAVFVRREDGPFQIATVDVCAHHSREISIYQINDCAIHPVGSVSPVSLTLQEIPAEVLVFIAHPLDSLNHSFFEELTAQALREECGLIAGVSVDVEGRVLHSGLVYSPAGQLVDPFAGCEFSQTAQLEHLNAVRSVEMIADFFFAVRPEHLSAVGGLSAISAGQIPQLVHKLVTNAHRRGLRVMVTPFAVASFDSVCPNVPVDPPRLQNHPGVGLNPNLAAFENLPGAIKGIV